MKLLCYSVRDGAVGAFLPPFMCRADGEARRSFVVACSDPKLPFSGALSDYVLFRIGSFDDVSGMYECVDPVRMLSAFEAVAPPGDPLGLDGKM
jgi:hypothetical protein